MPITMSMNTSNYIKDNLSFGTTLSSDIVDRLPLGGDFFIMEHWKERLKRANKNAIVPTFTDEQFKSEIWKPIPTWEGVYEASTLGRIRSVDRIVTYPYGKDRLYTGDILKQNVQWGYCRIMLVSGERRVSYRVHRLIAITFIQNPLNLPFVNHIDTIKTNNFVSNLEWVTPYENSTHARKNIVFNMPRGEKHSLSVYTNKQVLEMRNLYDNGTKCNKIVEKYSGNYNTIYGIVKRTNYKYL